MSKGMAFGGSGGSTIGYYLITPMVMSDGTEVFVNRGFVQQNRLEGECREADQPNAVVEIVGITAKGEPRNALTKAWMPKEGRFVSIKL